MMKFCTGCGFPQPETMDKPCCPDCCFRTVDEILQERSERSKRIEALEDGIDLVIEELSARGQGQELVGGETLIQFLTRLNKGVGEDVRESHQNRGLSGRSHLPFPCQEG